MIAALLLGIGVSGTAYAYWSGASSPGSAGASRATTVNIASTPTTVAAGNSVTLTWAASTLSTGVAVDGYTVARYNAVTAVAQTVLAGCNGTLSSPTCTESGVPDGLWTYRITATKGAQWTGPQGLASAAVRVDTVAPTNAVALSTVSGGIYSAAALISNTIYYRGVAAGSFTLTNAVADAGSGPASSTTAALAGTTTGWAHTPSTVSTPAGGPFQSGLFSWAAATTSSPSETMTGSDASGNTANRTLSMVEDSSPPSGGSMSYAGGYTTSSVTLAFAPGTDGGSGISTSYSRIKRSVAPLVGGACGAYVTDNTYALGPTSPYVDTNLLTGNCYTYQYAASDRVGNFNFNGSPNVVRVDTAAPTNSLSLTSVTGGASITGSTLYYRGASAGAFSLSNSVTDANSGPASSRTTTLANSPTGWAHTPSTVTTPAGGPYVSAPFSWAASTTSVPTETVTATDAAGNGLSTTLSFVNDNTAPSTSTLSYLDGNQSGRSVDISFTSPTDTGGSGIGTTQLQRATANLSGGACGSFSTFSAIGSVNPSSPYTDNTVSSLQCYKYQYAASDNVGNQSISTSTAVSKID